MIIEIALGIVLGAILLAFLPDLMGGVAWVIDVLGRLAVIGLIVAGMYVFVVYGEELLYLALGLLATLGTILVICLVLAGLGYFAHKTGIRNREELKTYPRGENLHAKWEWAAGLMTSGSPMLAAWFFSGAFLEVVIAFASGIQGAGISIVSVLALLFMAGALYKHARWKRLCREESKVPANTAHVLSTQTPEEK